MTFLQIVTERTSSLVASGSIHQHHHHYQPPKTYSHYTTVNEARRHSANYAWERRYRPPPSSYPHPQTTHHQPRSYPSSVANDPHIGRAADAPYYRPPCTGWKEAELDHVNHVNHVSGLGRMIEMHKGSFHYRTRTHSHHHVLGP